MLRLISDIIKDQNVGSTGKSHVSGHYFTVRTLDTGQMADYVIEMPDYEMTYFGLYLAEMFDETAIEMTITETI